MKRIAAILVLMVLLLAGCAGQVMTWQEQYDLGIRYLDESNYEEAILAFTQAIEIDPKNVDGYLGRAKAYLGAGGEENRDLAVADYFAAADICVEQGDSERAEELRNEAQNIKGDNTNLTESEDKESSEETENNLRMETLYWDDGTRDVRWYDADDLVVKNELFEPDGNLVAYFMFEYDEDKNYICSAFDANGVLDREEGYNASGKQTFCKTYFYNEDGSLDFYATDEYDENRNTVKRTFYNTDGSVDHYIEFEYDANGKLAKELYYTEDGVYETIYRDGERIGGKWLY